MNRGLGEGSILDLRERVCSEKYMMDTGRVGSVREESNRLKFELRVRRARTVWKWSSQWIDVMVRGTLE